jgi:hypothetical protein
MFIKQRFELNLEDGCIPIIESGSSLHLGDNQIMTPTPIKFYMTSRDKMKRTKSGKSVYLPTFEISCNPMIRLSVIKCDQGELVKKYMSDAGILFVINEQKSPRRIPPALAVGLGGQKENRKIFEKG